MSRSRPSLVSAAVCCRAHPHWITLALPAMLGVFFVLPWVMNAAVFLLMEEGLKPTPSGFLPFALLAAALCLWLVSLLRYLATSCVVTAQAVILSQGVIRHTRRNTSLQDISSVDVYQGLAGQWMGYGTVVVHGPDGTVDCCAHVPDPLAVRSIILQQRKRVLRKVPAAAAA